MKEIDSPAFVAAPAVPAQIADYLQAHIVQGRLRPGERIAEASVTAALGVSRGSVREALQLLAARHLVSVEPRRGARVTAFGPGDVHGLYELQICLLKLLATRVAEIWRPEDLPRLSGYRDALRQAAEEADTDALLALSGAFTAAACELVGNAYLGEALDRMAPSFQRAHYLALASAPGEKLELAQFVAALVEAVIARDPARIETVVEHYGKHQRDAVLAAFSAARAVDQAPP